ncbi:MAG TPA: hypothetical protein VGK67_20785 [Myxococcales bacterium]
MGVQVKGLVVAALSAAALAGCGNGGKTSASPEDVRTFDELGQQMTAAIDRCQSRAASIADRPACHSIEETLESTFEPLMASMRGMSESMDGQMGSMGQSGSADLTCAADGMMQAFARHKQMACASSDMAANRAEMQASMEQMRAWVTHQRARAASMGAAMGMGTGGMMGSGMMPDGGAVPRCQALDGGFFMGGEMMGGPGMMGSYDAGTMMETSGADAAGMMGMHDGGTH